MSKSFLVQTISSRCERGRRLRHLAALRSLYSLMEKNSAVKIDTKPEKILEISTKSPAPKWQRVEAFKTLMVVEVPYTMYAPGGDLLHFL